MYGILNKTNQGIELPSLSLRSNEGLLISNEALAKIDHDALNQAIQNGIIELTNLNPEPVTPTPSPSSSITPTPTPSTSVSGTPSPSVTPSVSSTPSASATPSASRTPSTSATPSPSVTPSASLAVANPTTQSLTDLISSILGTLKGFLHSATGAVLRTFQDKTNDGNPSVKDFYIKSDGNDYGPALKRALASGMPIYWPAGNYNVAAPVEMAATTIVVGASRCRAGGTHGDTYITAPKGLLVNTSGTRVSVNIKNIHVVGTGTGVAIQGPFGGDIEGCKFEKYTDLIQNPSSYLSRYSYNSFRSATNGLNLADSNGTVVEYNHFETSVQTAINNVDLTPLSGTNNGTPLSIVGNNFNVANALFSNQSTVKVRGLIIGHANYFEDFSSTPSGAILLDVTVNRWDKMGFVWFGNQMNGQGKSLYGIRLNGSLPDTCSAAGAIFGNRIAGFTGSSINFGTNNNIIDLRIMDNNYGDRDTQISGGPLVAYKPVCVSKFTAASVDVSSATAVDLPIGQTKVFDNSGMLSGNIVKIKADGLYRITAMVDLSVPTQLSLVNGSTVLETSMSGTILTILNLKSGSQLHLKGASGKLATAGTFTVECIGDGNA